MIVLNKTRNHKLQCSVSGVVGCGEYLSDSPLETDGIEQVGGELWATSYMGVPQCVKNVSG